MGVWACALTSPGITSQPLPSMTLSKGGDAVPMDAILPPQTTREASRSTGGCCGSRETSVACSMQMRSINMPPVDLFR